MLVERLNRPFSVLSLFLASCCRSLTKSLPCMSISHWFANEKIYIERFHLRGQHLCQFIGTKRKRVYIRKEFNSYKIGLEHKHGCRFIVLEHHRGPYDPTTATPMKKSLKNRIRVFWNFFALIQATRLLESREVELELKRGDCARVQGEIVKLERLRFPFTPNGKHQIQVENFWE